MQHSAYFFRWRACILICFILLGIGVKAAPALAHNNNPSTPSGYKLPYDPNRIAKITNGPNEGNHGVDCCAISHEAIDFVYVASDQWSAIRAAKAGTVIYAANPGSGGYGNLVII